MELPIPEPMYRNGNGSYNRSNLNGLLRASEGEHSSERLTEQDRSDCFVIQAFRPSAELVQKADVSLRYHFLTGFEDPLVMSEFRRFLQRDVASTYFALAFALWAFILPLSGKLPMGDFLTPTLCFGCVIALCAPTDAAMHLMADATTPGIARARSMLRLFQSIASIVLVGLFPAIAGYYNQCTAAAPGASPNEVWRYCQDIVDPYSIFGLTMMIFALRLSPCAAMSTAVVGFATIVIARFLVPHTPLETYPQLLIKGSIILISGAVGTALSIASHQIAARHFIQVLAVAKDTELSKREEAVVATLLTHMLHPWVYRKRFKLHDLSPSPPLFASVLFSDVVGFTAWSHHRCSKDVVAMLNILCVAFDSEAPLYCVEKIKTIGDAYWAVCGAPVEVENHAEKLCDFALQIDRIVRRCNAENPEWEGIKMRVGVHSGHVFGDVLGRTQICYEVYGSTRDIAAQCEAKSPPSRVTVSSHVLASMCPPLAASACEQWHVLRFPRSGETLSLYLLHPTTIADHRTRVAEQQHAELELSRQLGVLTLQSSREPPAMPNPLIRRSSSASFDFDGSLESTAFEFGVQRNDVVGGAHFGVGTGLSGFSPFLDPSQPVTPLPSPQRSTTAEPGNDFADFFKNRANPAETSKPPDIGEAIKRFTARRWRWFFLDLLDQQAETEYLTFIAGEQQHLKKVSRWGTLALLLAVFVASIASRPSDVGAFPALMFAAAAFLNICELGVILGRWNVPSGLHPVFHQLCVILIAVPVVLIGSGDTVGTAATHDFTYLYGVCTVLVLAGNVGLWSAGSLIAANFIFLAGLLVAAAFTLVMLWSSVIFLVVAALVSAGTFQLTERHYRQYFLEQQLIKLHAESMNAICARKRTVLSSLVPAHCVDSLLLWMQVTNMDPKRPFVRDYHSICIAFLRFTTRLDGDASIVTSGLIGNVASQQRVVEEILERGQYAVLTKIKTVGETVMIAGSFLEGGDDSLKEVMRSMVLCVLDIINEVPGAICTTGIHFGDVTGGVIGTQRLCFDIFGDAVNTASRAMSTGHLGDLSLTVPFCDCLLPPTSPASPALLFVQGGRSVNLSTETIVDARGVHLEGYKPNQLPVRRVICSPLELGSQSSRVSSIIPVGDSFERSASPFPPEKSARFGSLSHELNIGARRPTQAFSSSATMLNRFNDRDPSPAEVYRDAELH